MTYSIYKPLCRLETLQGDFYMSSREKRNMDGYENTAICAQCGGKCCQRLPGSCAPEDFAEPLFDSLIGVFSSGKYAIDWWEGDPRYDAPDYGDSDYIDKGYYVRPAVAGVTDLFDPSWGGSCTFLTHRGCALPLKKRPYECRMLEPSKNSCLSHTSKREMALAWLPYHDVILRAAAEAEQKVAKGVVRNRLH